MGDVQTERAYLKQDNVFVGAKRLISKKGAKIPR